MRTQILFHLLCTLYFFTPSYAQPKLAIVGDTSFSFGKIYPGQTKKHIVRLRNVGTADLQIQDITQSCACTIIAPRKAVLAPKKSLDVSVTIDTKQLPNVLGLLTKDFVIISNDRLRRFQWISFNVKIVNVLQVIPEIVYFDRVEIGTRSTRTVRLINISKQNIHILNIVDTSGCLAIQLERDFLRPGDSLRLTIHCSPKVDKLSTGVVEIRIDSKDQALVPLRYAFNAFRRKQED